MLWIRGECLHTWSLSIETFCNCISFIVHDYVGFQHVFIWCGIVWFVRAWICQTPLCFDSDHTHGVCMLLFGFIGRDCPGTRMFDFLMHTYCVFEFVLKCVCCCIGCWCVFCYVFQNWMRVPATRSHLQRGWFEIVFSFESGAHVLSQPRFFDRVDRVSAPVSPTS